jgi:hypothetical protein
MYLKALSILLSLLMFSSCASIISKSDYPVRLNSSPEGANVKVVDSSGQPVFTGVTPTTVNLTAKKGFFSGATYTVYFQKTGYGQTSAQIKTGIDGWYFGNLLFGGIIGMLIVDPATGAMWTLDEQAFGQLSKKVSHNLGDEPTLHIALLEDIPSNFRSNLVRVN